MKHPSVHESEAALMSAADVWEDAQVLGEVLRKNLLKAEPVIKFPIPLSVFLSALDSFSRDELLLVHRRVEERLAA